MGARHRWFVAVLVVAAAAVLSIACDDEPSGTLGPGIWVATSQPAADLSQQALFKAPIRVFDAVSRVERTYGPPSYYIIVRWSPMGNRLAALDLENKANQTSLIHLRMWDAAGKSIMDRQYGGDTDLSGLIYRLDWSPDGTRLAATSEGAVTMFDSVGREIGSTRATPPASGVVGHAGSGRPGSRWSPDSQHFATLFHGLLLVTDRDGHGAEFDLPGTPAITDMQFDGWRAPDTLAMFSRGLNATETPMATTFKGVLGRTSIAWDSGTPADFLAGYPTESEMAAYNLLLPGRRWSGDFQSADGSAKVVRLVGESADRLAPGPFALDVELAGRRAVIDIGFADTRYSRDGLDVIVRPGWKGSLPALVNAAKPLPSPVPTPTERPSPTPSGPATPYPSRGPDYPAPRGERVSPQVADLPVFPGSHEIDGFVAKGPGITGNVQMFSVAGAGERDILDFFEAELSTRGFRKGNASGGVTGEQRSYTNGRDRLVISTEYIPRPGEELPRDAIPYGFQGKGNRFVSTINGENSFYIVSLHAPEPR